MKHTEARSTYQVLKIYYINDNVGGGGDYCSLPSTLFCMQRSLCVTNNIMTTPVRLKLKHDENFFAASITTFCKSRRFFEYFWPLFLNKYLERIP